MASGKQLGEEFVVEVIKFSEANQLNPSESDLPDVFPIKFKSVQYGQKEHPYTEGQQDQLVSHPTEIEQCNVNASNLKRTERGKRKTGLHLSLDVLKPHYGKKLKEVAEELGVGRSTIKRACREHGIGRWPGNKKQAMNPSLFERESVQDSHHQEMRPSSSNSLHQNVPHTDMVKKLKEIAKELGVGRSTIKRACREHGISRWPGNKKQAINPSLFERESVQDANQQETRASSSSSLHQNVAHTNMESSTVHLIVEEEAEKVIIRVKYEEDTIKFELCLSLGVSKIFEEVARRLNLKMGSFKLKYVDEDNEEILISCDDDLQLCPRTQTATGKICIQLFVPK